MQKNIIMVSLAGLFAGFEDYEVLSNRESGTGRPDLMLKPEGYETAEPSFWN